MKPGVRTTVGMLFSLVAFEIQKIHQFRFPSEVMKHEKNTIL